MEKENLELVEFSKNFGQSGATNSFSVSSSLQQSFQINEQISGQSLVSQGKTEGIEPTREIKVEDFDILITKNFGFLVWFLVLKPKILGTLV